MLWLRHLLSIALLPFTVAVLVPWWIARRSGVELALGSGALALTLQGIGVLVTIAAHRTTTTAVTCRGSCRGCGRGVPIRRTPDRRD